MCAVITQNQYWNVIFPHGPLGLYTLNLITLSVSLFFQDGSKIETTPGFSVLPSHPTPNKPNK